MLVTIAVTFISLPLLQASKMQNQWSIDLPRFAIPTHCFFTSGPHGSRIDSSIFYFTVLSVHIWVAMPSGTPCHFSMVGAMPLPRVFLLITIDQLSKLFPNLGSLSYHSLLTCRMFFRGPRRLSTELPRTPDVMPGHAMQGLCDDGGEGW